jgi:hypothetical protein
VASGLFAPAVGGPSVYPPQPDGAGSLKRGWKASSGTDRYRRGLYTFLWRTTPHPMLAFFDTPDATRTCTRRGRSNSALQALILLNDEASFEFARALADRILRAGPPDEAGRIRYAFRLCLGRTPTATEGRRMAAVLHEPADLPDGSMPDGPGAFVRASEQVAWTTAARVLLNIDEFITRE